MKTTLFMATSLNGYVAGKDDDTDWVKDTEILYKLVADKGVCVMGRRTYEDCMKYNVFPYKNALNIVITHDQNLISTSTDEVIFTDKSPLDVSKLVEEKGFHEMIVMGGGKTNAQFLASKIIDEIIIDIHPIILETGVRLFEDTFPLTNLELIESKLLSDGMVQIKYRVLK